MDTQSKGIDAPPVDPQSLEETQGAQRYYALEQLSDLAKSINLFTDAEVLKNIENYGKKDNSASEAKTQKNTKDTTEQDSGKKVIIKSLIIAEGDINIIAPLPEKKQSLSVTLPTIRMQGIGEKQQGDSIPVTISKIISKILTTASQTAVKSKVVDLKSIAQENLDNVVGGVKDRVKSIGIFGK